MEPKNEKLLLKPRKVPKILRTGEEVGKGPTWARAKNPKGRFASLL